MGQRSAGAVTRGAADSAPSLGRRRFLRGLAAATGTLLAARATPPAFAQMPRIGLPTLFRATAGQGLPFLVAFRQGLAAYGYTEGKNIAIELRDAGGAVERLPLIIQELVDLPVSVFVLPLSNTVPMAAKATRTIPIRV